MLESTNESKKLSYRTTHALLLCETGVPWLRVGIDCLSASAFPLTNIEEGSGSHVIPHHSSIIERGLAIMYQTAWTPIFSWITQKELRQPELLPVRFHALTGLASQSF